MAKERSCFQEKQKTKKQSFIVAKGTLVTNTTAITMPAGVTQNNRSFFLVLIHRTPGPSV